MSNPKGVENFKKVVLICSIVLFISSLTQSFIAINGSKEGPGIAALIFGWLGIVILNPPALCWLANPILFVAWVYFKKGKSSLSLVLSLGATILSASFLLSNSIIIDEGGGSRPITAYEAGYWLWLSAMAIMMLGNIFIYIFKKPIPGTDPKVISQS
jgi:hypothetical protein